MFEHAYNRLVERVTRSGVPAQAEVLSAELVLPRYRKGISYGNVTSPWRVGLRISPESGAAFDLETKIEIPMPMEARLGETLRVIYNPQKPDDIIVDPASVPTDPLEASQLDAANARQALQIRADRLPEPAEPVADPIAAAREAAQAVASQAGVSDEAMAGVLRAQQEAIKAAMANRPPAPTQPPGGTEAAIEAKLAQLDALRASGALDEQTYNASRQRLIDALLR